MEDINLDFGILTDANDFFFKKVEVALNGYFYGRISGDMAEDEQLENVIFVLSITHLPEIEKAYDRARREWESVCATVESDKEAARNYR